MNRRKNALGASCILGTLAIAGHAATVEPEGPPVPSLGQKSVADPLTSEKQKENPDSADLFHWSRYWGGIYTDKLCSTTVQQLQVSAEGVDFQENGCFHSFEEHADVWHDIPGGLRLSMAKTPRQDGTQVFLDTEIYFFRWGGELFCIPRGRLLQWIQDINAGRNTNVDTSEARWGLRRQSKEDFSSWKYPDGVPDFPRAIAKLIVLRPATLKFVKVENETTPDDSSVSLPIRRWPVRLEVLAGEPMPSGSGFTIADQSGEIGVVEIQSVDGRHVSGELVYSGWAPFTPPSVGEQTAFAGRTLEKRPDAGSP